MEYDNTRERVELTWISVDYHCNLLDVHFCSKVHTSSCVTATQYINFKTTRNAIIWINKYKEHDDFIFTVGLLTLWRCWHHVFLIGETLKYNLILFLFFSELLEASIYLRWRFSWSKLRICRVLRRAFGLEVVWVPATEGPPILLCQIDASLRLINDEEWPE